MVADSIHYAIWHYLWVFSVEVSQSHTVSDEMYADMNFFCLRKCLVESSTSSVDEKNNTNRLLTGSDLTMDCVKSISELEPAYAKKWTGKSLTKAGLSQNFSRQDLAWTGLYLN